MKGLIVAIVVAALFCGMMVYTGMHRTVEIEPGLNVVAYADAAYMTKAPGGWKHQFWGQEQKADFIICNTGETVKYVYMRALCGWQIPIAGNLRLEPGEKTTISLKFKHDWWFWVEERTPDQSREALARN